MRSFIASINPTHAAPSLIIVVLVGCSGGVSNPSPEETATVTARVDASSFVDKVTAGYQAWFACPTDGSSGWTHWSWGRPAPGRVTFELYPDVREYDPRALCESDLAPLRNGQPSRLYNAASESVIETHFRWMEEYGIDGVGLQRFVVGLGSSGSTIIPERVRAAAERHGRIFYVMYDISGARESDWADQIKRDWQDTMEQRLRITASPQYARQDGRPVVNVWGIGSGDRPGTAQQALDLISWFKGRGVYVVGGVPYWWNQPGGGKPGFDGVYAALDMVQPWAVGTFGNEGDVDGHFAGMIDAEVRLTRGRGQAYQRVIWAGFAWSNWNGGGRNGIPRRAGRFFWRQAYKTAQANLSAYIAMFDEYDEGTAIAKAAEDESMTPSNQYFLTLDADGERVSSDFYLRLAGAATKMINHSSALRTDVPVPHFPPGQPNPTPTPTPQPSGAPVPVPSTAVRFSGELRAGGRIASRNGQHALTYQGDGNFVRYGPSGATWASNTPNTSAGRVVMQGDGNLVIYDGSGRPIWASNTNGAGGAFLALLEDGTAAVYRSDGNAVLWVAGGSPSTPPPTTPPPTTGSAQLGADQHLGADQSLTSRGGSARLTYQGDGNLVVTTGAPVWASHTDGKRPGKALMQGDGNFVIYDASGSPVFATNTEGHPGAVLVLADDGTLTVQSGGAVLWRSR